MAGYEEPPVAVVDELLDPLADAVAEVFPAIVARIPSAPAAMLGRTAVSTPSGASFPGRPQARPAPPMSRPPSVAELESIDPFLAERLLGALELTVGMVAVPAPEGLTAGLPVPTGPAAFATVRQDSAVRGAVAVLDQVRPGITSLVLVYVRALAAHDRIVPLLRVAAAGTDEEEIAAAHGAVHLAFAVATASAVLREQPSPLGDPAAAVVGAALGAVSLLLRDTAMPPAYDAALLDKRRSEYLLPRRTHGHARVHDHRLVLSEGGSPEPGDFRANGLVEAMPGGAAIRTGIADGQVQVTVRVVEDPPGPADPLGWDEIVEVSWTAARGLASVLDGQDHLREVTPPWPGDYRLRVHARNRDDEDETEHYELVVWSAASAAAVVHKRSDRLGYRLRGEEAPPERPKPEAAYRWVRKQLGEAATITVVTGSTLDEVLQACRADTENPLSPKDLAREFGLRAGAVVAEADDAVLLLETNGWQASRPELLTALSARGKAASMFWNVNALTRLSLAESGRLIAGFEPGLERTPELPVEWEDLDLRDYRDRVAKAMVLVERFTQRSLTPADLERLHTEGVGYHLGEF
ncbi:hypothetical protein HNR02_000544 [Amycolatopsis endophytica]|uniref:Uncharacterized protein n=1 Tax=Amycolatopsis endophytica TaxID=860233 RepID=A0A853AXB0_9PSEU|nr:DUF6461 domain-containing protein [Amycolatopsis endophytica]NYI87221.1 hypothetical protein [Amycolatopsis endophytica]